ncbi:Uncharacterised protein [uncultured archaeon]|nr:Uncharacterised protein [uncultured archaeon]
MRILLMESLSKHTLLLVSIATEETLNPELSSMTSNRLGPDVTFTVDRPRNEAPDPTVNKAVPSFEVDQLAVPTPPNVETAAGTVSELEDDPPVVGFSVIDTR